MITIDKEYYIILYQTACIRRVLHNPVSEEYYIILYQTACIRRVLHNPVSEESNIKGD
jgi:hypothetical protein